MRSRYAHLPQAPDEGSQDHQTQDQTDHDDGDLDECGGLVGEQGFDGHLEHRAGVTSRRASASPGGRGREERGGAHLSDRLPLDQDRVRIFLAGAEHGHRALDLHDAVATLRQSRTSCDWSAAKCAWRLASVFLIIMCVC